MNERVLRCYVRGRAGRWEAMCIDLDIAVDGVSQSAVVKALEDSVIGYVEAAQREAPLQRDRLLHRTAPFWVRWRVMLSAFAHVLLRRRGGGDLRGAYEMACTA